MTDNSYQGKVYKAQGGTELVLPDGTSLRIEDGAKVYKDGVDITSPLGGSSGGDFVKISSGTISSPVEYFDVALPGTYSSYVFDMTGVEVEAGDLDKLSLVFSFDGGATWVSDEINNNTYAWGDNEGFQGPRLVIAPFFTSYNEVSVSFKVFPGSASSFPAAILNGITALSGDITAFGGSFYKFAYIPTTPARATHIRIFASADSESSWDFEAGTWTIYGVN